MKKLLLAVSVIFIFSNITYSIDTVSTKYFPLLVGNSWTYYYTQSLPPTSYRTKHTITGTLIRNGHLYYNMSIITTLGNNNDTLRIDSVYGRLLKAGQGCPWNLFDLMIDSLSSVKNDSFYLNCTSFYKAKCTDDTSHFTGFGLNKLRKTFVSVSGGNVNTIQYAKDIGMTYESYIGTISITYTLLGCIVNGVKYGDTNLVGVKPIAAEIPQVFRLYQNYPNPFNPTTKIKLDIPSSKGVRGMISVKLIVFDISGREITKLVNEELNPGTYEVEWDASDYPSGVYFYKLITNQFSETKRMVLLK